MSLRFEWDVRKALINARKHGVAFEEARSAFGDPLSLTVADRGRDGDEFRFVIVGRSVVGRLLVVWHVKGGDTIRLISARVANRRETKVYEEGQDDRA